MGVTAAWFSMNYSSFDTIYKLTNPRPFKVFIVSRKIMTKFTFMVLEVVVLNETKQI